MGVLFRTVPELFQEQYHSSLLLTVDTEVTGNVCYSSVVFLSPSRLRPYSQHATERIPMG